MKALLLTTLSALTCLSSSLHAKDYTVVKADPIATVTFPDTWKVQVDDDIINSVCEDETIQLTAEVVGNEDVQAGAESSMDYLKENKVKIDLATQEKTEGSINGLGTTCYAFDGTDEDGPCTVSLIYVRISDDKLVLLLHWSPAKVEEKQLKEVMSVVNSIKKK